MAPVYFEEIVAELGSKKKTNIYKRVRLETCHEGLCVQMMHKGPYDEEQKSLDMIYSFIKDKGYEIYGRHHEIYMNDPRLVSKDRIKTILRYPIKLKKELQIQAV